MGTGQPLEMIAAGQYTVGTGSLDLASFGVRSRVDSLMDISQPYYGQLQKLCGTENPNVHVSATQATQPVSEMKAGRVLMLKLTDGVTDVQGMEYRPIPALNTNLLPGCKIRVKGRLLCRKGVLFLKSENLEILGGEVDSLVESNKQDILLQNALASTDQAVRNDQRQEFSNTEIIRQSNNKVIAATQGQTTQGVQNASRREMHNNSKPLSNKTHSKPVLSSSNANQSNQVSRQPVVPGDEMDDDDDFLESLGTIELAALDQEWDEDMEDFSTETRRTSATSSSLCSQSASHVSRLNSEPNKQVTSVVTGQKKPLASVSGTQQSVTLEARSQSSISRPSQLGQPSMYNNPANQNKYSGHMSGDSVGQRPGSVVGSGQRYKGKSVQDMESEIEMELENLADFMDDDFPMDDFEDSSVFYPSEAKRPKQQIQSSETTALSGSSMKKTNTEIIKIGNKPKTSQVAPVGRVSSLNSQGMLSNNMSRAEQRPIRSVSDTDTGQSRSPALSSERKVISHSSSASSRSNSATSNVVTVTPICTSVNLPLPDFKKFTKPEDLISHLNRVANNPRVMNAGVSGDEPFTYLSSVWSKLEMKKPFCVKVKAYVATLLSRLDSGQGLGWNLTCRLNDGTSTLDVDLTDEVLTQLIGFSAQKSLEMKKGDAGERIALSEGIKNCQLKLINISCIFRVDYQPSAHRAKVIEIIPISIEHIQKLYLRVCHQVSHR